LNSSRFIIPKVTLLPAPNPRMVTLSLLVHCTT
jgi:hypothetical protein